MELKQLRHIHFLGIGGIGMSAIALYFMEKKCRVSGYDRVCTPLTEKLEKVGAEIQYGDTVDFISEKPDAIVYTPAISRREKVWEQIASWNIPCMKRSEVLGLICSQYKTLAISGSHGKTTTSTLLGFLLRETVGCTAFLGGISNNYDTNYWWNGQSPWLVVEADEYDRSFHTLYPLYSVITSMEADHLDIYGDMEGVKEAFGIFAGQTSPKGKVFVESSVDLVVDRPHETFQLQRETGSPDIYAENLRVEEGAFVFDYIGRKEKIRDLRLTYPGEHNVKNAIAAISIALEVGVPATQIRELLPRFKGVKRRFDKRFESAGRIYIDDYAHHPGEIDACLTALRTLYTHKRIRVIFQPHLYSRTRDLAREFARSLEKADELLLLDIYPARELPIPGVSSESIGRYMQTPVTYLKKEEVLDYLDKHRDFDVLVSMGAGNIDTLVLPIQKTLEKWQEEE